jgi:hypothetical protein
MAYASARIETDILFIYLIVTYTDRQEAPDIPSYSLEQFGFCSEVWARTQTTHAFVTPTRLKSAISGQSRNKTRFCRLDGFLRSTSKCYISADQG